MTNISKVFNLSKIEIYFATINDICYDFFPSNAIKFRALPALNQAICDLL